MSRCVVKFREGYANITADELKELEGMIYVYLAQKLMGVFDLGTLDAIYLSGKD